MIADGDTAHIRAHGFDDACALVAEDNRRRMGHQALYVVEVAVAHATGDIANAHFVRPWLVKVEHFYLDTLTRFVMDGRLDLHGQAILLTGSPPVGPAGARPDSMQSGRQIDWLTQRTKASRAGPRADR